VGVWDGVRVRVGILVGVGRVPVLVLVAVLVWLGGGLCACLVSLFSAIPASLVSGGSLLWLVCLLPGLPFFSTLLLLLFGQPRRVWILHLAAPGLAAALALFLFIGVWLSDWEVILWGAGLYGATALLLLAMETLAAWPRQRPSQRVPGFKLNG
jgi:hypothetical protein